VRCPSRTHPRANRGTAIGLGWDALMAFTRRVRTLAESVWAGHRSGHVVVTRATLTRQVIDFILDPRLD